MNVHRLPLRLPLSVHRPAPLIALAGVATLVLTAYTLLLHALRGRHTPVWLAFSWSSTSVVAWSLAGLGLLALIEHRAFVRDRSATRRVAELAAATICAIALAAAVRALLSHQGPFVWSAILDAAVSLAARWSAPGAVLALLVMLAANPRWRIADSAHQEATPVAADSPAPRTDARSAVVPPPAATLLAPPPAAAPASQTLAIRVGTRTTLLSQAQIITVEADGNYVRVHARGREYPARGTLQSVIASLDPHRFVRVHRTIVVAVDAVRELRTPRDLGATALLRDGRTVPVSRAGVRALRARLGAVR
ncbi:MAG: LytTR family transcriptional regulator [Gemmatimonadaceae bacterium]|nr:LytTR family transcriptional regulator [Gemmatimonadaceae bacterium]